MDIFIPLICIGVPLLLMLLGSLSYGRKRSPTQQALQERFWDQVDRNNALYPLLEADEDNR